MQLEGNMKIQAKTISFVLLILCLISLGSQSNKNQVNIDDFAIWHTQGQRAILAAVSYQSNELSFFSPSKQGFIGKVNAIYFSEPELKNQILKRQEKSIFFPYGQNSFSPEYKEDTFGARWTASFQAEYTETYKFLTRTDDGVRLWINDKLVIDKWQDMGTTEFSAEIPLVAGSINSLKMEYYDRGGDAYAELGWESPSTTRRIINEIGSFDFGYIYQNPFGLEEDWNASYYKGRDFKELIQNKREIALSFTSNKEPFAKGIPNENFCAKFISKIKIIKSGSYRFFTTSDDGIRLKVKGQTLIDQWTWMGPTEFSEKIDLQSGEEVIVEIDYFQGGGGKYLKVEWQTPDSEKQILIKKGQMLRINPKIALDIYPGKIYSRDLNKDGKNDLIILHPSYNGKVSILYQTENLILSSPVSYRAGKDPEEIIFGDFNLDSFEDMIIKSKSNKSFLVFWNQKNSWKEENSPNWENPINFLTSSGNELSTKNKSLPTLFVKNKSGKSAKIQYLKSNKWGTFETISEQESRLHFQTTAPEKSGDKCVPFQGSKKICYQKEEEDFYIQ